MDHNGRYFTICGSFGFTDGKSNCGGKFLEAENKLSLIALIGYSFTNDVDLDDCIMDYCSRNNDYIADQMENSIIVARTTVIKDGECVSLQSRAYLFNLEEYFQQVTGKRKNSGRNRNMMHGCVYGKG